MALLHLLLELKLSSLTERKLINLQELCNKYSPEPSQSRNSPETAETQSVS